MRVHDGAQPYSCSAPGCDKSYGRIENLRRHMLSHNPEDKPYRCTRADCDKAFATKQRLNRHEALHDRPTPFQCEDCGEAFRKKTQLASHRSVHTGTLPYPCTEDGCGKTFSMPSQLRKHLRTHAGKTYVCCEEPCLEKDVAFTKFTELQKHIRLAHPRQLECRECSRLFSTRQSLANHEKTHAAPAVDRLNYPCPVVNCGLAYTKASNLRTHIRAKHTQAQSHVCTECEATFAYKQGLKNHMRVKHSLVLANGNEQPKAKKAPSAARGQSGDEMREDGQCTGNFGPISKVDNCTSQTAKRRRVICQGVDVVREGEGEAAALAPTRTAPVMQEGTVSSDGVLLSKTCGEREDGPSSQSVRGQYKSADSTTENVAANTTRLDASPAPSTRNPEPSSTSILDHSLSPVDSQGVNELPGTEAGEVILDSSDLDSSDLDKLNCEQMWAVAAAAVAACNASTTEYNSSGFRAVSAL